MFWGNLESNTINFPGFQYPDSTEFMNPFRPHCIDRFKPNGVIRICPTASINENKIRPYMQQVMTCSPQISVIKSFPITENFVVGSLNSLFVIGPKNTQFNVTFPNTKRSLIECVDVHPSEVILACNGPENNVRIVSLPNGDVKSNLNSHTQSLSSIMFAPSFNKLISTSFDGSLIISDFVKEKCCYKYEKFFNKNSITTSVIRNDESLIIVGLNDGNLGIFDNRDNNVILVDAHRDWINSLDITSQKYHNFVYFASSSIEKDLKVWDFRNLKKPILTKKMNDSVSKIMFSDDDSVFSMSLNGILTKYCFFESKANCSYNFQVNGVTKADLHPELRRVLFSCDDSVLSAFYF